MTDEEKRPERNEHDYEYFQERVKRWRDYFGLFDWAIITRFEDIGPNRAAEVDRHPDGRFAAISLNTRNVVQLPDENDYRLCKSAFHEIVHIILADLAEAAIEGVGWKRAEPMEEAAVRRLETVVHDDILRYWRLQKENQELAAKVEKLDGQLKRAKAK